MNDDLYTSMATAWRDLLAELTREDAQPIYDELAYSVMVDFDAWSQARGDESASTELVEEFFMEREKADALWFLQHEMREQAEVPAESEGAIKLLANTDTREGYVQDIVLGLNSVLFTDKDAAVRILVSSIRTSMRRYIISRFHRTVARLHTIYAE